MRLLSLFVLFLAGCTVSTGGLYTGTGSHPHVSFAVSGAVGPVEVTHAPTTQKGANDLLMVNATHFWGDTWQVGGAVGWAWWRDWGDCDSTGHNCEHTWTNGLTAGVGVRYVKGAGLLSLRPQVFTNAPFDVGLLLTAGLTL